MSAFTVLNSTRDAFGNVNGSVSVERTGKTYGFTLFANGAVMLVHGTRSIPETQLRDVRDYLRNRLTTGETAPSKTELRATTDAEMPPVTHSLVESDPVITGAAEWFAKQQSPDNFEAWMDVYVDLAKSEGFGSEALAETEEYYTSGLTPREAMSKFREYFE